MWNSVFEKKSCIRVMRVLKAVDKLLAAGQLASTENLRQYIDLDPEHMRELLHRLSQLDVLTKMPKVTGRFVHYRPGPKAKDVLDEKLTVKYRNNCLVVTTPGPPELKLLYTLRQENQPKPLPKPVVVKKEEPVPDPFVSILTPWSPSMSMGSRARTRRTG